LPKNLQFPNWENHIVMSYNTDVAHL